MSTNSVSILHNAIMEASGKNQTPMLALSNYITCLATPATDDAPTQEEKEVLDTYATVRENIKKMIDVEAKAVHIILNGIDNYICSIVDAYPNAKEMWKAIGHLKQAKECKKAKRVQDSEDKPEDQELKAHYMYMAKIQDVIPAFDEDIGPIFDSEPLEREQASRPADPELTGSSLATTRPPPAARLAVLATWLVAF
ncbi:hypothetical protein Tco_0002099 [Tanacetum coccineum]